jgi:hypothetical protein
VESPQAQPRNAVSKIELISQDPGIGIGIAIGVDFEISRRIDPDSDSDADPDEYKHALQILFMPLGMPYAWGAVALRLPLP